MNVANGFGRIDATLDWKSILDLTQRPRRDAAMVAATWGGLQWHWCLQACAFDGSLNRRERRKGRMKMVSLLPLLPPVQSLTNFLAWYNFDAEHETLKVRTPAMAGGLSDHVWTIKELMRKATKASRAPNRQPVGRNIVCVVYSS